MKVLIAPDKFKDALDAATAAEALAEGVRDADPSAECELCPLADGGEGSGAILAVAAGAKERVALVRDPLGRKRKARWWYVPKERRAIVEMAEASGLHLLKRSERNPLKTTSFGTGELIRAAVSAGARRLTLCVGGSATVDGGAGCLQALGWRFCDRKGREIKKPMTGGLLVEVAELLRPPRPAKFELTILTDVNNPLLGVQGAARVYAPQKGASRIAVERLETAMAHWVVLLARATGASVQKLAGGGAAGGLPAGLSAALGGEVRWGFEAVALATRLSEKLADCAICLTGEGRLDEQDRYGKVVGLVAALARTARPAISHRQGARPVPVIAFVGEVEPPPGQTPEQLAADLGLREIIGITPAGTPLAKALKQSAANLRRAAAAWRRQFAPKGAAGRR